MINDAISKQTFFEVWGGNSTPLQRKLIKDWLSVPGNIEVYYQWLDEWERNNLQVYSDVNISYQRFLQGRTNTNEMMEMIKPPFSRRFLFKMIAATVVGVILAVSFYFSQDSIFYKTYTTAYGEVLKVDLPDESVIFMNANTSVRYSRFNFNDGVRRVYINGEAEFEVVHTEANSPFEVYGAKDLKISVLGTKFVVYSRGDTARVVLREGKIQLTEIEAGLKRTLMLKPGEQFTKDTKSASAIVTIPSPENVSSWKNHEFIFESIPLNKIGLQINEAFGYKVKFEADDIALKTVSGSFRAETALELVDAIAQLLDMNYNIVENEIFFSE